MQSINHSTTALVQSFNKRQNYREKLSELRQKFKVMNCRVYVFRIQLGSGYKIFLTLIRIQPRHNYVETTILFSLFFKNLNVTKNNYFKKLYNEMLTAFFYNFLYKPIVGSEHCFEFVYFLKEGRNRQYLNCEFLDLMRIRPV